MKLHRAYSVLLADRRRVEMPPSAVGFQAYDASAGAGQAHQRTCATRRRRAKGTGRDHAALL